MRRPRCVRGPENTQPMTQHILASNLSLEVGNHYARFFLKSSGGPSGRKEGGGGGRCSSFILTEPNCSLHVCVYLCVCGDAP